MSRPTLTRACLDATNSPHEALALAVKITWWRRVARLESAAADSDPLPLPVRRARDAEIARREAA